MPHKSSKMNYLHQIITEWIVIDGHPFHIIQGKGFQHMMAIFDSAFRIPSNITCKNIIAEAYDNSIRKVKALIIETCEFATITVDLWTARNKTGFIGITCHWLTSEFKIIDLLLCCEQISYPHTSETISSFISTKLKEFNLEDKVFFAISDNGSNMISAFNNLEKIIRIPCIAHNIHLSVNKGLRTVQLYTKKFQKLVKFFTTSVKQTERLDQAQLIIARNKMQKENIIHFDNPQDLNNEDNINDENEDLETLFEISRFKLLRNISDIHTRWNSSFYSWQRLLILQEPIQWLAATLPLQQEKNIQKDAQRLNQYLLKANEWKLLQDIVDILKPFESVTTYFSGIKYPTISMAIPIIETLKKNYMNISNNENIDESDDGNIKYILYLFLFANIYLFIYLFIYFRSNNYF
jgi:hypothetical protein